MQPNAKISRASRKLFRLCVVRGVLDEARARQVVRRIAASRRRGSLALLWNFRRLVRLDRDRHTAVVESATPLGTGLRERLSADLARIHGPGLRASFEQNPALIGGVRITIGSDVYDGSLRARLAALAARL